MGGTISAARLSLSPSTFNISPGAGQDLLLTINLDGIPPGLYQGSLMLTSGNASPLAIPLSVFVEPYRTYLPVLSRQ
jgi:hypothetical protein